MIILAIHASSFSFNVREKAVKSASEPAISEYSGTNVLALFTSVEEGDENLEISKIVNEIKRVSESVKPSEVVLYPYAHLSDRLAKPSIAVHVLGKMEEALRESLRLKVTGAPFGWYKAFQVSCLGHPLSELSLRFREGNGQMLSVEEDKVLCEKFSMPTSSQFFFIKHAVLEYILKVSGVEEVRGGGDPSPGVAIVRGKYSNVKRSCFSEDIDTFVYLSREDYNKLPPFVSRGAIEVKDHIEISLSISSYELVRQSFLEDPPTLPMWAAPAQVRILPVKREYLQKALEVSEYLGVRTEIDDLDDGIGSKIRRAGQDWVNYVVILGEREDSTGFLTVKVRKEKRQVSMSPEELRNTILAEDILRLKQNLPRLLSKRIGGRNADS